MVNKALSDEGACGVVDDQNGSATPVVSTLDEALSSKSDCILRNDVSLDGLDINAQIVLLGGHRASGKSEILKKMQQILPSRIVHNKTDTTRPKRIGEDLYEEEHKYLTEEQFKLRLANGTYAFAYQHSGWLYGVPLTLLLSADQYSTIVIPFVSHNAFSYVLKENVFPNALKFLIKTEEDKTTSSDLEERLRGRYRDDVSVKKIANETNKAMEDRRQFSELERYADAVYINNDPEKDLADQSKPQLIARKILLFINNYTTLKHSSDSGNEVRTHDSVLDLLFFDYVKSLVVKLSGRPLFEPPTKYYSTVNLIGAQNLDRTEASAYASGRRVQVSRFLNHVINRNGALIRTNGVLQLLYSLSGSSRPLYGKNSLQRGDDVELIEYIRHRLNSPYGDVCSIADEGYAIYYRLTDVVQRSSCIKPTCFYIGFEKGKDIASLKASLRAK